MKFRAKIKRQLVTHHTYSSYYCYHCYNDFTFLFIMKHFISWRSSEKPSPSADFTGPWKLNLRLASYFLRQIFMDLRMCRKYHEQKVPLFSSRANFTTMTHFENANCKFWQRHFSEAAKMKMKPSWKQQEGVKGFRTSLGGTF